MLCFVRKGLRGGFALANDRTQLLTCKRCHGTITNSNPSTVYVGKTAQRVKRSRIISLTSSLATTILAPIIAAKKLHLSALWMAIATGTPMTLTYMYTAVVVYVTQNYVTEMYFKAPDKLIIKKYNLFCREIEQEVNPIDIEAPMNVGMLESFRVNNESYLVDEMDITDPQLYESISGLKNKDDTEKDV